MKKTISIIKSLQANSKSKVLQNGHLSDQIVLGRGCRQGDPISPYLFVLAVELLGEALRKHKDLDGIKICGKEQRISQFADDTTLFMKYNESNLRICMSILYDFYIEPNISEMDNLVSIWRIRNLTLIGKITIIKTLMI